MTAQRVPLDCGCAVIASHDRGDVLVTCAGSDGTFPDVVSIGGTRTPCPGGLSYAVSAREVRRVEYTARPVSVPGGAA